MDITVEKKGPCLCSLKVAVTPEEIKEEMDKKYDEAKQAITLPGFRRGKVPRKLIVKKFGDAIIEEVKENLIKEAYSNAIDEHDLNPIAEPDIDLESIEITENAPMEFEITVETKPDFELGEYKGIKAEVPAVEVTDEEIDQGVEGVLNRFASLQAVEGKPVKKGDYLTAKVTYGVEGEEDFLRDDCQVNTVLGNVDGVEVKAETIDLLVDKNVGDTISFDVPSLPDHFNPANLRGSAAKVNVEITEIKRVTPPEMDEKFLKMIGAESKEDLRKKVSDGTIEQKTQMRQDLIDEKVIDKLIEDHTFDLPEKVLEKQSLRQEFTRKMEMVRMGFPEEEAEKRVGEMREKNRESAERFLRYSFIYDKIADKEKVFVTEGDVDEEFRKIAASKGTSPEEARAEFEENDMIVSLRARIREDKIRNLLREKAEIVEINPEEAISEEKTEESNSGEPASSVSQE
jgi:trigger factor